MALRLSLARLRKARGWTFGELARDVHRACGVEVVSESTVGNFLRGASVSPRIETILRDYLAAVKP